MARSDEQALRLRWSGRVPLTTRILAVNILALAMLAGGFFYLDSYRARLLDTDFAPGPESIEAQLFTEAQVPWEELAFRTVKETLLRYFEDRRTGRFDLYCADIG